MKIEADPVDEAGRPAAAQQMAQRLGCVVALKGRHTIISDGLETHVNRSGNAALATAGTGDVLTGLIAGLIAQFFTPHLGSGERQINAQQQGGMSLMDCARLGAHIHGAAADQWAEAHGHAGMLATDLLAGIPNVLHSLREHDRRQ
jgi:NAD(P)H-hydrate epimerase